MKNHAISVVGHEPVTTLAEMGSRAEAVESFGLMPCWESRVLCDGWQEELLQYLYY